MYISPEFIVLLFLLSFGINLNSGQRKVCTLFICIKCYEYY